MKLKILFEDENLIVAEKPAGINVYDFIKVLSEKLPGLKEVGSSPRYGLVHRLDKETSGLVLIAKNNKALEFFQKQFAEKKVIKKYLALVVGKVNKEKGEIETLIGRADKDRKKQKAFLPFSPQAKTKGKRWTKTLFKVKQRLKNFTLLEVTPETGRRHQIRVHLAFLHHPIAGDKIYGFKNQPCPEGLERQFLHAGYIKIKMLDGKEREFRSVLPEKLRKILEDLNPNDKIQRIANC